MARIFTTLFSYNGKTYTAVISQLDSMVNIYIPDESLHDILPRGKVTFNPAQGLKIDTPKLSPAQHLLLNVLSTIECQEKTGLKNLNGVKQ